MDTIKAQLIGNPHDGQITTISGKEMRGSHSVFVPYVPADSDPQMDLAYAQYERIVFGTQVGQVMAWANPHLTASTVEKILQSILQRKRSAEGVWLLQGADVNGNLQMQPLNEVQ